MLSEYLEDKFNKPLKLGPGLFSWSDSALEEENAKQMFGLMKKYGLTVLYQRFPYDISDETLNAFFKLASAYNVSIYYLTGEPEWALEASGEKMCNEVERASKLKERITGNVHLSGIIMDTEPYLLGLWEDEEDLVLDTYVSAMEHANKKAEENGLSYIACIPYFYDQKGHVDELVELMEYGCDALAIMNYSKRDEAGQIRTEIELAKEKEKPIVVIYELQKPGVHGLHEFNTYFNDGLGAVEDSVSKLKKNYGKDSFQYALHEYNALHEYDVFQEMIRSE